MLSAPCFLAGLHRLRGLALTALLPMLFFSASPVSAHAVIPPSIGKGTPSPMQIGMPITLPVGFGTPPPTAPNRFRPQTAAFPASQCAGDKAWIIGFSTPTGFEVGVPYRDFSVRGNLYYLWCAPASGVIARFFPDGFNFAESIYTLTAGPCENITFGATQFDHYFSATTTLDVYTGTSLISADYRTVATLPNPRTTREICPGQTLRDFSGLADARYNYVAMVVYNVMDLHVWAGYGSWMATPYPR